MTTTRSTTKNTTVTMQITLSVTVPVEDYEINYGVTDRKTIRNMVASDAANGLRAYFDQAAIDGAVKLK